MGAGVTRSKAISGHWAYESRGVAKLPYESLEEARAAAARMAEVEGDPGLVPYQCRVCQKWHIGHLILPRAGWWGVRGRQIDLYVDELGLRVVHALKSENVSEGQKKFLHVRSTAMRAEAFRIYGKPHGGRGGRDYESSVQPALAALRALEKVRMEVMPT